MKKVVIAGASGLIGSSLLKFVLEDPRFAEVVAILRKPLEIKHPKLRQLIVSFEDLDRYKDLVNGDALYCCLGTTRSKTPDLAQYRIVDHDYPVKLAQLASENKIMQYHLVSALGASLTSPVFYNKLKAETERDVTGYIFRSVHIYRPSLLIGTRKETRIMEGLATGIMKLIDPLLFGSLKRYQSIKAEEVAKAMIKQTFTQVEGTYIYPSDEIKELA